MTTDAGLPSVRESLQLAHLAEPEASPLVAELAADHYHLNYSKHPVPVLFRKVRAPRTLLAGVLPASTDGTELHRQLGRLSKLLGNLAFHLDDPAGARTHLSTAVSYANRCGDTALAAWAYGAQSLVARHTGNRSAAYTYAERGAAAAPTGLVRAQLHVTAHRAMDLTDQISSHRTVGPLQDLVGTMASHQTLPAVRDLSERVTAVS
ncbi:hypothetical protein [Streptomyces sp. NBC_01334]|uniref:hypothetical protein n=1 Tax=Streptomyces sp. NBC_01334 TaxID=2903827 RepID=UPI002E0ECF7D|nr:hypothetical protein OG736_45350 [Streptomyces sp. NBC_01334]